MAKRIDRRSFIKGAAFTTMTASLGAREVLSETMGGKRQIPDGTKGATTTNGADRMRGAGFRATVANVSGIPLGGIGAGSVEIRPDGYFNDWLIFNMGAWSPEQPPDEGGSAPEMGAHGLQFFARCSQTGKAPQLRRLGMREDATDLYSVGYAKPVEAIEFDGKFPCATLEYVDSSLPVQITGIAFAPVIPNDARTSGTPGFTIAFKIKNVSKEPVDVSLMGTLRNPLAWGAKDRALANAVTTEGRTTCIALTTAAEGGAKSTRGSMAISVTGGKASHIAGSYGSYLSNGWWGGSQFGSAHYSYLHAYNRDGRLPSLAATTSFDDVLKGASEQDIEAMDPIAKRSLVERLRGDAFFHEFLARIEQIEPGYLPSLGNLDKFLGEVKRQLDDFSGPGRDRSTWGDAALESTVHLKPGEEREIRFALSWFFPNHFSALGTNLGHQYEHWFNDALEVNRFLTQNHGKHREEVVRFAETMLGTNLDPSLAFGWGAQLTTMIKSSWWCKDGRFAIWEGLGCCGLHTTDITYQGSFPLIALYPELQKGQIKMGASYQRKDGRIPHFFSPDLLHVDNGFDRVDMNPQYVMMVCRDYLWTGDRRYALDSWPHVVRAMNSTQRLDGDGDGIPDRDTRRNTYDQWDMEGSPAYICSLWLGALRSSIRLAHDLGQKEEEASWRALLEKASKSFVTRLWNGEYFDLWVSDTARDECCMSDQLSGEWYTGMMGLGHSLPSERILAALGAVHRHNFDPEQGLLNATYPPGRKRHFKTDQNLQAAANWTGIEYANAALMIDVGMVEEGLSVMRSVHDRYARSGRRWNHVECGDHYFRAMSSWSTHVHFERTQSGRAEPVRHLRAEDRGAYYALVSADRLRGGWVDWEAPRNRVPTGLARVF
ncbi:MAG TPA: GH116 family glycosyl hydrolase [Fimbriimonadaceae bacterium]|nr:GH116 family glycosyl hydrolase [Fimbriimonadaceae bacterium]